MLKSYDVYIFGCVGVKKYFRITWNVYLHIELKYHWIMQYYISKNVFLYLLKVFCHWLRYYCIKTKNNQVSTNWTILLHYQLFYFPGSDNKIINMHLISVEGKKPKNRIIQDSIIQDSIIPDVWEKHLAGQSRTRPISPHCLLNPQEAGKRPDEKERYLFHWI